MQQRKTIGISLNQHVLTKIDSIRGHIPRSRFIEEMMLKVLVDTK